MIIVDRLFQTQFIVNIIIRGRHCCPHHIVNGSFIIPLPLLLDYCSHICPPHLIITDGMFWAQLIIIIIRGRHRIPHQSIIIIYKNRRSQEVYFAVIILKTFCLLLPCCCCHIENELFTTSMVLSSHNWFHIPPPHLIILGGLFWTQYIINVIIRGRYCCPCHIGNKLFIIPISLPSFSNSLFRKKYYL